MRLLLLLAALAGCASIAAPAEAPAPEPTAEVAVAAAPVKARAEPRKAAAPAAKPDGDDSDYQRAHDAAFHYVSGVSVDAGVIHGIRDHETKIHETSGAERLQAVEDFNTFLQSHDIH